MNFTTPAFVRAQSPQERRDLKQWLKDIGYGVSGATNSNQITTCPRSGQAYFGFWSNTEAIECDSIRLFKALAAMNSENDRDQWFVCEFASAMSECSYMVGTFELSKADKFPLTQSPGTFWRKATIADIIEHFKN